MKTKLAAMGGATQTFVDDVFSTYLYTGNGSTQTITNGIDLAGKGGMVWTKDRTQANNNVLQDTINGVASVRSSNLTSGNLGYTDNITAFSSTGYSIGAGSEVNNSGGGGSNYVSWTFREAPKFFDVVTYTGNGVDGRAIPSNLNMGAGYIGAVFVKRIDASSNWKASFRGGQGGQNPWLSLNQSVGDSIDAWTGGNIIPDVNGFSVYAYSGDNSAVNASGGTYVAYIFAHDTSAEGIIRCGSFTTDGSGNATVNLGWEPQWIMVKRAIGAGSWQISDVMRGLTVDASVYLYANGSGSEASGGPDCINATGFSTIGANTFPSSTYIYMAIRRPNKPPTSGTQVFNTVLWTGNQTNNRQITGVGFNPDYVEAGTRSAATSFSRGVVDRLRGTSPYLMTYSTNAEQTGSDLESFDNDGITVDYASSGIFNNNSNIYGHFFKRAPGFFDEVCYTGNGSGSGQIINHNLGVTPELIIIKSRSGAYQWHVYVTSLGQSTALFLEDTSAAQVNGAFTGGTINSTQFQLKVDYLNVNGSGVTYVSYLFATLTGISKVGSYTGNGSSQNIECGFAAGARFFLVKATSTTGSWWVWDSARGITAGNDPALQLNSTAAEITTADAVDPYAAGITVNQEATCSINASGVAYIFLAVS